MKWKGYDGKNSKIRRSVIRQYKQEFGLPVEKEEEEEEEEDEKEEEEEEKEEPLLRKFIFRIVLDARS